MYGVQAECSLFSFYEYYFVYIVEITYMNRLYICTKEESSSYKRICTLLINIFIKE
jgi:hypothetical protein